MTSTLNFSWDCWRPSLIFSESLTELELTENSEEQLK